MCDISEAVTAISPTARLAIWQIPDYQLCSVVGTCLELRQLKKLKKRFSQSCDGMPLDSDYDLHVCCVSACRDKNAMSKSINKILNRQYSHFVQTLRSLKDEVEIRQLWQSIKADDLRSLTGYYWAILTNPQVSVDFKNQIYGQIHMISHICGQQEKTLMQDKQNQIQQLQFDLQKKTRTITQKKQQIEQLREVIESLQQQIIRITSKLPQQAQAPLVPEKSARVYNKIINLQMNGMDRLQTQVDRQRLEIERLKKSLNKRPRNSKEAVSEATEAEPELDQCRRDNVFDLNGKKILYVGGFARHRNKFQQLTEKINGSFLYHDGGKQQSVYQLDELVKRADAIFCPIDCISHGAVDRIKSLTRSQCKDCIFLRSASLSSFKTEVVQYASNDVKSVAIGK